jgi:hypothetical protein
MTDALGHFTEEALADFYSFADCADGEKMIFGVCRKVGGSGEKDFDSSKKTKQETEIEKEGEKQKSTFENNKPFMKDGKRYGWAMKNGKKVAVAWGDVAGEKKVGAKKKEDDPKKEEERKAKERRNKIKSMTADQREKYRAELMKTVEQSSKAKEALKELEDVLKEQS